MCLFLLLSPLQADVRAEMDSVNTVKFNLTADVIEAIFRTYPSGAQRMKDLNLFCCVSHNTIMHALHSKQDDMWNLSKMQCTLKSREQKRVSQIIGPHSR